VAYMLFCGLYSDVDSALECFASQVFSSCFFSTITNFSLSLFLPQSLSLPLSPSHFLSLAFSLSSSQRSEIGEGVEGPNQRRFLHYYLLFLQGRLFTPPPSLSPSPSPSSPLFSLRLSPSVLVLGVEMTNPPYYGSKSIFSPHIKMYSFRSAAMSTVPCYKIPKDAMLTYRKEFTLGSSIDVRTPGATVRGDFQIRIFHR
jgi:hypothetical protein